VSLEGLPDVRSDFAFGQVCALIANVNRRDEAKTWAPDDFFPALRGTHGQRDAGDSKPPDPEQQSQLISALLGRSGSKE
jgi:hypothetical protein